MPVWIATAAKTTGGGLWDSLTHFVEVALTIIWDSGLTLLNVVLPRKAITRTEWPPFVPRTDTDSRSPCPGLNALASHGIFPHDGRNIKFTDMTAKVHQHFNFSTSFSFYVSSFIARILHRDYRKDTFDLGDISVHNGIEHDGSLTRYDTLHQPDQGIPAEQLILELLAASSDGKKITAADLSRVLTARFAHSKETNPQFSLSTFHQYFGAGNAATLFLILGGDLEAIKPFLLEERLRDGWTSSVRARMGLTMAMFNLPSLRVMLGVDPAWKSVKTRKSV